MAEAPDPRKSFGPVAERYATSAVHANPAALSRLIELVQPQGGKVLDVATGSGNTALTLAPHVDRIVASDMTHEMAAVCRRLAVERGIENLQVAVTRAEALAFRNASFDGVTCRIAPHHFHSPPHFIGEVSRVLQPGGWFLLIDNVGPADREAARELDEIERERDPSHISYLSADLWRGLLADYKFIIRHEETAAKKIDVEDWLERMNVPDQKREPIRQRIRSASAHMQVQESEGRLSFQLAEHLFFATKPRQ